MFSVRYYYPTLPSLSIINEDETGARPFKGHFATTIG
jgi:hypothetical protein